jgi:hypothetical protein
MEKTVTKLYKPLGGLFLMTIMTTIWTIFAAYFFNAFDYYLTSIFFGLVLVFFVASYFNFNSRKDSLPKINESRNPQKEKMYWIIFAVEGIAIFIAKNILINIGRDDLFIPIFALIVGLHFIPLAKVFERKFDYYIGTWTTITAVLGIIFTLQAAFNQNLINAFVCTACAVSTTLYGTKMIFDANTIVRQAKI